MHIALTCIAIGTPVHTSCMTCIGNESPLAYVVVRRGLAGNPYAYRAYLHSEWHPRAHIVHDMHRKRVAALRMASSDAC
jgi:hypothetical protein